MNKLKFVVATLLVGFFFAVQTSAVRAVDVHVKKKAGVPVGVIVTLTSRESQALGRGERVNIPLLPGKFEKPFHKLSGKIKAADNGNGVKVTLTLRVFPNPGISDKVESL